MPTINVHNIEGELAVICTLLTTKVSNSIEILLQENAGLGTALEESRKELERVKAICKKKAIDIDPPTPPETPVPTNN